MRNTLRKLLSFLLVLTLILGSGYANYGVEKNTSIHLKTEDFNVQDVEAVYVIITGEHGNLQSGIIDYVLINYDLSTSDPEIATKIKMTANGGVTQFTAPDFSLSANSRILYFEIYKVKYYVGQHISLVGKEGGPELDSAGGTVNYEITCIPTYNNVYYNGNGNTTGTVPIDNLNYYQYDEVTVKSKNDLVNTNHTFTGWNTQSDGLGTPYAVGSTFSMGTTDVTLYAQWIQDTGYTVTYNGNGNTGGAVPSDLSLYDAGAEVTVKTMGTLVKTNHTFSGWNTQSDGLGTSYASDSIFNMGTANVTLYAQWTENNKFLVTYMGNGNTGGAVPIDNVQYHTGAEVTVKTMGTLVKTNHTFSGWNTQSDGLGTSYVADSKFNMGTTNIIIYAKWIPDPTFNVIYNANGATSGSVPVDVSEYFTGDKPVVAGNTGTLALASYYFNGWNTAANGSGAAYTASQLLTMGTSDIILYAQWSLTPPPPPPTTQPPSTTEPLTQPPSTTEPPTTEPPTTQPPTTQPSSEDVTNEPIPGNPASVINFDEPLDSSTVEELVELETEETPLAPALPQTGQLPVELFYGIGGLITAMGVFLKRK